MDGEAVCHFCRAIEYFQQRRANRAAVFTPLTSAAGKLDTKKASVAFRTGDNILFHKLIMLHGNPACQSLFGRHMAVACPSHQGANLTSLTPARTSRHREGNLRSITDHERAQIAGWIALFALMLLGAYIMLGS